jgi:hypothetical protein
MKLNRDVQALGDVDCHPFARAVEGHALDESVKLVRARHQELVARSVAPGHGGVLRSKPDQINQVLVEPLTFRREQMDALRPIVNGDHRVEPVSPTRPSSVSRK